MIRAPTAGLQVAMRFGRVQATIARKDWIPAKMRAGAERRLEIWRHRANFQSAKRAADMGLGEIGT